jgi:hypothetical protein
MVIDPFLQFAMSQLLNLTGHVVLISWSEKENRGSIMLPVRLELLSTASYV